MQRHPARLQRLKESWQEEGLGLAGVIVFNAGQWLLGNKAKEEASLYSVSREAWGGVGPAFGAPLFLSAVWTRPKRAGRAA